MTMGTARKGGGAVGKVVQLYHPRPKPRNALLPIEAVDAHRDIWCRHYDGCLDVAVRRGWISWSCASCPLRGQAQVKPELRVQVDSVFADVPEAWTPVTRPDATTRIVYRRLSNRPMTVQAIARGQYRPRSEERRVGKEGRTRASSSHDKAREV